MKVGGVGGEGRVCVCDQFSVSTRPGRGNETSKDRQVRTPLPPSVLPCLPCRPAPACPSFTAFPPQFTAMDMEWQPSQVSTPVWSGEGSEGMAGRWRGWVG